MEFSEEQKTAIRHKDGPMMVLAGPGSGKTTVITHRVKNLVQQFKIPASKILVVTFTKAAADEMKNRFEKMVSNERGVTFGTFHSIFFWVLRNAYNYTGQNVLSEVDKIQMIKEILIKENLNYNMQEDFIRNLITEISLVKSDMRIPGDFESSSLKKDEFYNVYTSYNKLLENNNKIDFDDMQVYTYELFRERPDILELWSSKFQYVMIDEFQDVNKIQYEIVKQLTHRNNNIFIVGDDDQSVYSFRGSDPEIFLGFENDFKGTKVVKLSINYRCCSEIVRAAGRVIKNNKKRFEKNIVSPFMDSENERIKIIDTENIKEENKDIIERIQNMNQKGIPFSKIAVLYRTNTQPRSLAAKLNEYNIPFVMRDGVPNIFKHFIAENLFDYIYMALGDRSRKRMLKVMNRPNRYISRDSLTEETVDFNELKSKYNNHPGILNNILVFENDLERIKHYSPFAAINYIRKAVGYNCYIREYASYRNIKEDEYMDILDEIEDMSKDFDSFEKWFEYIQRYEEQLIEASKNKKMVQDAVVLSTMHGSKGLEFDQVFLMNCVEDIMPYKKAVSDREIEEERRMFYVAMTRARYGLYVYTPKHIYGKPRQTSRFVSEMLMDIDLLKTGNRVRHKKYGEGVITFVDDRKICILFEKTNGVRTLSKEVSIRNNLLEILAGR